MRRVQTDPAQIKPVLVQVKLGKGKRIEEKENPKEEAAR